MSAHHSSSAAKRPCVIFETGEGLVERSKRNERGMRRRGGVKISESIDQMGKNATS